MELYSALMVEAEAKVFTVNGPLVVTSFDLFGMTINLTESVIIEWIVMAILISLFYVLGKNLKVRPEGKRQVIAEMIVGYFVGTVNGTMGVKYKNYTPYIAALFCFSLLSSLMSIFGLRSPTGDLSVIIPWGITTFVLVLRNKIKTGGIKGYLKGFFEPMPFMLPFNIIGDFANPVSQTVRHFANILAGSVISGLLYFALGYFAIIVPAALSLYFDIFSSVVQAYIFTTLTMAYVSMAES